MVDGYVLPHTYNKHPLNHLKSSKTENKIKENIHILFNMKIKLNFNIYPDQTFSSNLKGHLRIMRFNYSGLLKGLKQKGLIVGKY